MKRVTRQNAIVTQLGMFAQLCDGRQKAFYTRMLADLREVCVDSITSVFTEEEIKRIKRCVKPKQKQCYKNAHMLTALFPDRVQYVEGYMTIYNGALPVEHAWNKVDGKYVDITLEMALHEDPTKELYMSLGVYNLTTITMCACDTGYYGGVYNNRLINNI